MKTYLIVGGSSGIGKSLVDKLKEENRVFATYNEQEMNSNGNITYIQYDVLSESKLELNVDALDGMVYCPGTINLKPFSRVTVDELMHDFKINLIGSFRSIQDVLQLLKRAESASIVMYSTIAVQQGMSFHSSIASSKGSIEGLTRSLAAELAPKIRVNAIAPSIVDTPLASRLLSNDSKIEASANRHPLKKIGSAEDISNLTRFLLSSESSWITGQIIGVDGGLSSIKNF